MNDGPNPTDKHEPEEKLQHAKNESVDIQAVWRHQGRDDCPASWNENVKDEAYDVPWFLNFDHSVFASIFHDVNSQNL